jgi:hypothetical protein
MELQLQPPLIQLPKVEGMMLSHVDRDILKNVLMHATEDKQEGILKMIGICYNNMKDDSGTESKRILEWCSMGTFFTGLAGLIGMIAGASISGIWEWVNGKSTAELNQRKGALESKNPWLKDPQKREAAYEAMRYCRDRCIRYDGYGEAIE